MKTSLVLFSFGALLVSCWAHLCLLSPAQRGSLTMVNNVAAADCYLMTSPCGGRSMDDVRLYLRAGQNFTVVFQKNVDHWSSATPGDFTVRFGIASSGRVMFDDLAVIPDAGEKSLSVYTADVRIPDKARGLYVLQVNYRTNNPVAPPNFYQCADLMVV